MFQKKHFIYSVISGCLLGYSWNQAYGGLFLFIAFVPLLLVHYEILGSKSNHQKTLLLIHATITFLIWNILAMWWICKASLPGGIIIILFNTTLFSLVFLTYHLTQRQSSPIIGLLTFVTFWVSFEYLYTNSEISWPILNLGNGLSNCPELIQWYEYTGIFGGSAWILSINYLFFLLIKQRIENNKPRNILISATILAIVIPVSISLLRFYTYAEKINPVNVIVIQPNIDPYQEKFGGLSQQKQLEIITNLAMLHGNINTDYFVGPETAIDNHLVENNLDTTKLIIQLRQFALHFPKAHFIIGATTYRTKKSGSNNSDEGPECFNSALHIDTSHIIQLYHKSKLVLGIEKVPFPKAMMYFHSVFPDLGGAFGNRGTQEDRTVFKSKNKRINVAPIICYESCFGEFSSGFVQKGANVLFIITNDGWFGNSPGPWIHLNYARMRAIENRRSIARSANTGISSSINQRGEITKTIEYGKRSVLETTINANTEKTYYTKHGDYLGYYSCWLYCCIAIAALIRGAIIRNVIY